MRWFDTREGKMIVGEAAYEDAVVSSGPGDIVPLVDLITPKVLSLDTSSYDKYHSTRPYKREDLVLYGQWVLNILAEAPEPQEISQANFYNLSKLGLGPGIKAVKNHLGGSVWNISRALGIEKSFAPMGTYDNWEEFEFVENAQKLAATLQQRRNPKPNDQDYEEWARSGNGPSPRIIQQKIGYSTRQMNELIGFPNTIEWSDEQFIDWGVDVMIANNGCKIVRPIVRIISSRQRGPGLATIVRHFGNIQNFQALVTERYKLRNEAPVPVRDEPRLEMHVTLLTDYLGERAPQMQTTKLELAARFEVARQLLHGLKNSELAEIAYETNSVTFVERLTDENYHLASKQIKSLAKQLNYYDLIWPESLRNRQHLKISESRLATERYKYTARNREHRRSYSIRQQSA